ncbi:MAG TPA: sulfatase-like hydrolase/transferase [Candidatus Kapabacteria bacterium]|nr:sulfatase-like hydrolase/transferase [Candidatus Kapabacteria bacterium]
MSTATLPAKPNIIIIMTDQQREIRDFPHDWVTANLPAFEQLRATGITYRRMYINTSPCWASRAVMVSGTYPMINQVIPYGNTLAGEMANLATILNGAGYNVAYKGKWHLTNEFDQFAVEWAGVQSRQNQQAADSEDTQMGSLYGFGGWTSPDMGTALVQGSNPGAGDLANLGGGVGANDNRIVTGTGLLDEENQEGVLEFLRNNQNATQPFCLVVSLVNPHDVSVYPDCLADAGYSLSDFENYQSFELPKSYGGDDLSTKPWAQLNYLNGYDGGPLSGDEPLNFLKFYAYLHTLPDALIGQILDTMTPEQRNSTLIIRTADHGEMGMAHGGLREKMNTCYEETINIPLVISNPLLFTEPAECRELVSLIDLPTTIASIAGVDIGSLGLQYPPQGIDFSGTITDPTAHTQDAILFTFYTGYNFNVSPSGIANIICAVVTKEWKYAVYFQPDPAIPTFNPQNPTGIDPPWQPSVVNGSVQYELYDLANDPHEITNLLPVGSGGAAVSASAIARQKELHALLTGLLTNNGSLPGNWSAADPS